MKNPGIIALASMIDASQFFLERLYVWRNCVRQERVWPGFPHCLHGYSGWVSETVLKCS